MSFRRRPYQEVLDNILTGVVGGVAAESHAFPPLDAAGPPYVHFLEHPPVADVISVFGSRNGRSHRFRKNVDYVLQNDAQSIAWQTEGAELPDAGTLITVNYYPTNNRANLTDIHPGSVLRTLSETVALEIGRLYAQLEVVYQSGFIDTAAGSALDNVVALLGVDRVTGAHPAGEVLFTRADSSRGAITIPAGTRITTVDGEVEYEVAETVTLLDGQKTVRVIARDLETENDPLEADALTVLPIPIAGIAAVANPNPTSITTQAESDAELRTRAKNFLHGSERATLSAIREAITRQGVTAEVTEDPTRPGYISVTVHTDNLTPELNQRIQTAIDDARPAGIVVAKPVAQAPRKVSLSLKLTTAGDLLPEDLRAAQAQVGDLIADYFAKLPAKAAGSLNKIVGLVLSAPGVEDVQILSATWDGTPTDVLDTANGVLAISGEPTALDKLHIADPNLPTLITAVFTYPENTTPPDSAAITSALSSILADWNTRNAADLPTNPTPAQTAEREVSFGKLLFTIPLPGKPAGSLADALAAAPAALPDETDISPITAVFTLTTENGLSQILSQAGDTYALIPFERLSLTNVEVTIADA